MGCPFLYVAGEFKETRGFKDTSDLEQGLKPYAVSVRVLHGSFLMKGERYAYAETGKICAMYHRRNVPI